MTRAAEVVAAAGVPVVLMHHQGAPETMQDDPRYGDVLVEVYAGWRRGSRRRGGRHRARQDHRRSRLRLRQDVAHNLELMNGLALFHALGCPLMLGASRKRTIGALSNEAPADQRLGGHRPRAEGGRAGGAAASGP